MAEFGVDNLEQSAPKSASKAAVRVNGIERYGFLEGVPAWFFIGQIDRPPTPGRSDDIAAVARFDRGGFAGRAMVCLFERPGLAPGQIGLLAMMRGSARYADAIVELRLQLPAGPVVARSLPQTERLEDLDLIREVREILVGLAPADASRLILLRLISRPLYRGHDTTTDLSETVLLALDEIILCPPDGLIVIGWRVLAPGSSYTMRLRSGQKSTDLIPEQGVSIPRPDVVEAIGREWDFVETDCGFIVYLPGAYSERDAIYLEIETSKGAIAFKNAPMSSKRGIGAIKRILQDVNVRYAAVDRCFDTVIGPAVMALNRERLESASKVTELTFGPISEEPSHSIIVPLFGRIDFMEYQLALFSRDGGAVDHELIYVLDDPPLRSDLERLAHSAFERFGVPFRILMLNRNFGFAPANNIGLRNARGRYVCFLNSDAFPKTGDWLTRLTARLEERPDIGIIGPRLLFEDGSIQHEGCYYHTIPEFADWTFLAHYDKGLRPRDASGVRLCPAITGACMVLERSLAVELGGFDEDFIIGDFEDSDLCQKIKARGLECAVDLDVELYHLERKSQAKPDQAWRQHLTLYNAWIHQRRWFSATANQDRVA